MYLLAINSLYSRQHKKEKKIRRKKSITFGEENMGDAGYPTRCFCFEGYKC